MSNTLTSSLSSRFFSILCASVLELVYYANAVPSLAERYSTVLSRLLVYCAEARWDMAMFVCSNAAGGAHTLLDGGNPIWVSADKPVICSRDMVAVVPRKNGLVILFENSGRNNLSFKYLMSVQKLLPCFTHKCASSKTMPRRMPVSLSCSKARMKFSRITMNCGEEKRNIVDDVDFFMRFILDTIRFSTLGDVPTESRLMAPMDPYLSLPALNFRSWPDIMERIGWNIRCTPLMIVPDSRMT